MKTTHLFAIFALLLVFFSCGKNKKEKTVETPEIEFRKDGQLRFYDSIGETKKTLEIEIAKTDYDQETGLMYRKALKENHGMLFTYDDERPRPNFYMKNTYIPLDLVYINANYKLVDFNQQAQPMDETNLSSDAPAKYVLEINGGKVRAWQLKVGDSISFIQK